MDEPTQRFIAEPGITSIRWSKPVVPARCNGQIEPHPANPPIAPRVLLLMDTNLLDIKFARMGARLKIADRPARRNRTAGVERRNVNARLHAREIQFAVSLDSYPAETDNQNRYKAALGCDLGQR